VEEFNFSQIFYVNIQVCFKDDDFHSSTATNDHHSSAVWSGRKNEHGLEEENKFNKANNFG